MMGGAVAVVTVTALLQPRLADPVPWVAGSFIAFTAGLVAACWPHPRDDTMAVADATREPGALPRAWTDADWDDLDRELKGQQK
jgi:hypothetical protein